MSGTPPWLWPNLLSLDAPIVALVWQDLAAHAFSHPLRPAARIVLGLTVWAVYLADRLLDVSGSGPVPKTARHVFYQRHPRALATLLAAVLALDAVVAVADLRHAVFLHGLGVAGCAGAYLAAFPSRPRGWEKQISAAVLFSAGVLLVSGTWVNPWRLVAPGILFGALCLCNLALMELWEQHRTSRALLLAPAVLAALAVAHSAGPWTGAVAVSGLLLAAVAAAGPRLPPEARGVLADAVLLTPLLFR